MREDEEVVLDSTKSFNFLNRGFVLSKLNVAMVNVTLIPIKINKHLEHMRTLVSLKYFS